MRGTQRRRVRYRLVSAAVAGLVAVAVPAASQSAALAATPRAVNGAVVQAPPTISSFSPLSGPTGTSVSIYGTNYFGVSAVKFHGVAAAFTVNSPNHITATVPNGATTGPVAVTTPGGTTTSGAKFTVTLGITSFSPSSAAPGVKVTINGVGFNATSAAAFNGVGAGTTFVSPSKITATVPTGMTTGHITVVNTSSPTGGVTSQRTFTAAAPSIGSLGPSSGPTGTAVGINGTNYFGVSAVKFNGLAAAAYTVNSSNKITASVPNGATTGPVTVTTPEGTVTSAKFTVTLGIASFSPSNGGPGAMVSINGEGFNTSSVVRFNGTTATVTSYVSSDTITAPVPSGATTGRISVVNTSAPTGTVTSAGTFTVAGTSTTVGWPSFRDGSTNAASDTAETAITAANVNHLTPIWENASLASTPYNTVEFGGVVYGVCASALCAVNATTGQTLWTAPGGANWTSVADGLVFTEEGSATIGAVNASTGSLVWTTQLPDEYQLNMVYGLGDGHVYAGGFDGRFFALDAATGTILWSLQTASASGVYEQVGGKPVLANGTLFLSGGAGTFSLWAVDPDTGQVKWTAQGDNTDPVISGDLILETIEPIGPGSTGPNMVAYSTSGCGSATCTPVWSSALVVDSSGYTHSIGELAVSGGTGYVVGANQLVAFDTATGRKLWQTPVTPTLLGNPTPTVAGDVVYLGADNNVWAYPAAGCGGTACSILWRGVLGWNSTNLPTEPYVVDGTLFFEGYAFRVADQTHPAASPPSAPSNVVATLRSDGSIDLTWSPSQPGPFPLTGYQILTSGGSVVGNQLPQWDFANVSVPPGTYTFTVIAYSAAGKSVPSKSSNQVTTPA